MNKLQQAYIDLGLKPGAPLDQVLERWRTVARMWHPDRASTEQEKTLAEAELKKVNGARDLIARHYQDGLHKLVGCECATLVEPQPERETQQAPPPSSSAGNNGQGAKTAQRTTAGKNGRAKRRPEPVPAAVGSMLTAAMVLLGMFIVHMNSGVRLQHQQPRTVSYDTGRTYWTPPGNVSQTTIAGLRPSPMNTVAQSLTQSDDYKLKDAARDEEEKARRAREAALTREATKKNELPANTAAIGFVSSDGRLVSLKDGTTWELLPQEAADSFFAWQPGDRITVKGAQQMPVWLVNESRSFQAVKVTPVR
jgi:curved DNA-binding protein CbpA